MEILLDVVLGTIVFVTIVTAAVAALTGWYGYSRRPPPSMRLPAAPPGPRKLPLIGHLHLLIGSIDRPHACFARLAHKYGPVMLLQLGEVPTAVISSPEAAKQVMKTHDSVFSERPYLYAAQSVTYNFKDIVFGRGEFRAQIRKICVVEMLSPKGVESFRGIRVEEMTRLVASISNSSRAGSVVNLKKLMYASMLNILCRTTFGGKCQQQQDAFQKLLPDLVALFGGLSVVDLYPSLRLLHLINSMRPKLKSLHKNVDDILESIIQEHRAAAAAAAKSTALTGHNLQVDDHPDHDDIDLIHVLLDIQDRGQYSLSTSNIKAILLDLFIAGTETSATLVEWAMSEMLRNPQVLERAQTEVRHFFAGTRDTVDEEGIHELKYLSSVIKETLRLYAPPLLLPRECKENCEVNGCVIPAKCRVIVNAWAIGRNHNYWSEADKFYPERFLDSSISYKGTDFEFIPFGAGRRICPGMLYGMVSLELALANLLYHFDWKLPNGKKPEDLDMTEVFSASLRKKQDLCVVPIPYHYDVPSAKE